MANVNELVIEDELLEEGDFTPEELNDANTDWKAKAEELKGLNQRRATKLRKAKEALSKPVEAKINPEPVKKIEGFDYAEKTFIRNVLGASPEDYDWIKEVIGSTGKTLDDLETSKHFKAELSERREIRATKEAIPTGTKRSASAPRDEVSYWANKPFHEVPQELKREVLKAREKVESNSSKFTDRPVGNL